MHQPRQTKVVIVDCSTENICYFLNIQFRININKYCTNYAIHGKTQLLDTKWKKNVDRMYKWMIGLVCNVSISQLAGRIPSVRPVQTKSYNLSLFTRLDDSFHVDLPGFSVIKSDEPVFVDFQLLQCLFQFDRWI